MESLPIRRVIERVSSGTIRIPAFQRGFVWDPERVSYLMDSIYKGYPFGAAIVWRTKTPLHSERQLGPFVLPETEPGYPIDYVLDGQQRLTSIFGVFQTELIPQDGSDTDWINVYFDCSAEEDIQESQFVVLQEEDIEEGVHFPVKTFFDTIRYRDATKSLDEETQQRVDAAQAIFKEAVIPFQLIETDDKGKVAIVFERVNRMGMELDILQLLSAWTWSEQFDLQEKFADLSDELDAFGFGAIGEDSNLLLRCCSAVIGEDASSSGLLNLNGSEVRDRFEEIENGINGSIEFLRKFLQVRQLKNLPYPTLLVPLTVFFAHEKGREPSYTDEQYKELRRWFWRASFTRRYSAGVLKKLNRDIAAAKLLRDSKELGLGDLTCSIGTDFFSDNQFIVGSVNTSTFILLLAQLSPKSFVSGAPVSLDEALNNYNRTEFHHCFPRDYLKGNEFSKKAIDKLANFSFLTRADNRTLGGDAPSKYKEKIPSDHLDDILQSACCPQSLFSDEYEEFISERSELLLQKALSVIGVDRTEN